MGRLYRVGAVLGALAIALLLVGGRATNLAAQVENAPLVCSVGAAGVDNCLIALANPVPPGDTLTATLQNPGAVIVGCATFPPASCSLSGNSITLNCPAGCPQGDDLEESIQTYAGVDLSQQVAIAGPTIPAASTYLTVPQMSSTCVGGVDTAIGCIPSASYLQYLQCLNAWTQACSFDLGAGYTGYYFPTTATYAFYTPVQNSYSFYTPSSSSYYAYYSPATNAFTYWNPTNGYYATTYPTAASPAPALSSRAVIAQRAG
jgi:hypothetical protein